MMLVQLMSDDAAPELSSPESSERGAKGKKKGSWMARPSVSVSPTVIGKSGTSR